LVLDTLRLTIAYRPARHFAVWAALTGNVLFDAGGDSDGKYRPGYSWAMQVSAPSASAPGLKIWPGFALGFEF
jgi:hypothetical protein